MTAKFKIPATHVSRHPLLASYLNFSTLFLFHDRWWSIFISDAMSRIQSGPSIYVKEGSVLNLTCVFSGHVTSAKHIHWWERTHYFRQSFYDIRFRWRGSELLNTADRGGISIVSNKVQEDHWTMLDCKTLLQVGVICYLYSSWSNNSNIWRQYHFWSILVTWSRDKCTVPSFPEALTWPIIPSAN